MDNEINYDIQSSKISAVALAVAFSLIIGIFVIFNAGSTSDESIQATGSETSQKNIVATPRTQKITTTSTTIQTTTTTSEPTTTTQAITTTEKPTTTQMPESSVSTEPTQTTTPIPGGPSEDQWAALRNCEATGNYQVISGNGLYYGAYQFNIATWDSTAKNAGRNDLVGVPPNEASVADQDAMARQLYSERGDSPWPSCGRFLK